jgi:hypothetical protein
VRGHCTFQFLHEMVEGEGSRGSQAPMVADALDVSPMNEEEKTDADVYTVHG